MIEITRQLSGIATKVETLSDAIDLVEWAQSQDSLYFTISGKVDGSLLLEAGGSETDTVTMELGNWIVFDGQTFHVYQDDNEFVAAGYSVQ